MREHEAMGTPVTPTQRWIILVAFAFLLALFGWGMLRAPRDDTAALTTAMKPYFDAIDEARYSDAYELTTGAYRQAMSREQFASALGRIRSERGKTLQRECVESSGFAEFRGATGFTFRYWLTFERGDREYVFYRVLRTAEGSWRIDASGKRSTGTTFDRSAW
jgi:hypothetical protein